MNAPADTAPSGPIRRTIASLRGSSGVVEISWFHIVWIFVLASIAGLLAESFVSYFADGYAKSRYGLVWGPFSPIYGCGAVLFTLVLNKLDEAPAWVMLVAAGLWGALFEFCAGWFWEHVFGIVAWSYADRPFNLLGYTSLEMACVWAVAGFLWMRAAPHVVRAIDRIPICWRPLTTTVLTAFLVIDVAVTLAAFSCWFDRLSGEEPAGAVAVFFDEHFGDDYMEDRFEVMSMWPSLADARR